MSVRESPPEGETPIRLGDFIRRQAMEILNVWSRRVHALPGANLLEGSRLLDHMPELLERIAALLGSEVPPSPQALEGLPQALATERLSEGFDLGRAVAEYGILRECILELYEQVAGEERLEARDMRGLNRAIDGAIATAVATHAAMRERMLAAIERLADGSAGSSEPDTFLPSLMRVLLETTEAVDSVVLFLLEDDTLRVRAAVGAEEELVAEGFSLKVGEGFVGKVAQERRPLELRVAASDPLLRGATTRRKGIRALLGMPLLDGDALLGVVRIGSLSSYVFSQEDKLLFRSLVLRICRLLVQTGLREREQRARARAEESLALVDAILANSPVGFALLDLEGRFVRVNPALASLHGCSVEAHLGRRMSEVLDTESAARAEEVMRRMLETGAPVLGMEDVLLDEQGGVRFNVQASFFPVRLADGRLLGAGKAVVDVTRLKQSEEALRAQRDLLESLFQAESDLGQGFAISRGQELLFVNEAICRITGYSAEELRALPHYLELVVPEQREWLDALLARRDDAQALEHYETAIRHKAGYRVELEMALKHLPDGRLVVLFRDITERKQAQQDREQLLTVVQSERHSMEAVLESLPVGVLLAEAPSGRILRGNPQLEKMLGHRVVFSPDVARYRQWHGFHPGEGRPYQSEEWPLARALSAGESVRGEEMDFIRPDGVRRTVAVNAEPIRDDRGEIVAAVMSFDDITERKRAEAQLTSALSFRDQLIGILGHDLRNPLGAIKMSAGLIRLAPSLPERALKALSRIEHSVDRMGRMIGDLLDFTQSRFRGALPVAPAEVDLHEISRAAVDELAVIHPDRMLELELKGSGHGVWDPGRMAQMVSNLVANALQYGDPAHPVLVAVSDAGPEVLLEVSNLGEPIPAETLPALFEPFRRGGGQDAAAKSPAGLGLGLYIVREIVRAHGGTIEARSSREEGTRFTVRLPRAAAG